jgi:Protein N-terminal asparagine amidohydrolase
MVLLLPTAVLQSDDSRSASQIAENAQKELGCAGCTWQPAPPAAVLAAAVSSNEVCTLMASQFKKMEDRQAASAEHSSYTLQVLQRECGVINALAASPAALGSDAATTCHIVAFRDPATCRTALAHLDSAATVAEAVSTLLTLLDSAYLDCYIVGGYEDPTSDQGGTCFTGALLAALHAVQGTAFRLVLACCGTTNTQRVKQTLSGRVRLGTVTGPVKRSLAVCAATGQAWPIYFAAESRGPGYLERSCRTMGCHDAHLMCIYNCITAPGLITVPLFYCDIDPQSVSYLLSLQDDVFLQYTSTSPLLEGMYVYADQMHAAQLCFTSTL